MCIRLKLLAVFGLMMSLLAVVGYTGDMHFGHSDADMTMHHMHVMIYHAMEMAAEGSNLVMLGLMNMTKGI